MTWDPTPWFVGGGAIHSPEIARVLAYAATGAHEGVIDPGDLFVQPTAVNGSQVRVGPGACIVRSRAAGGSQQSYVGRNPTDDLVSISATTSAGARIDLIAARIEDPYMPGEPWAKPADPTTGKYVKSAVVPNVPASAIVSPEAAAAYLRSQGYSAIPLAAVSMPVSTATVTSAYIKDLRLLAAPRSQRVVKGVNNDIQHTFFYSDLLWHSWPNSGAFSITIPDWATHFVYSVALSAIAPLYTNATTGYLRLNVNNGTILGDSVQWDVDASVATNLITIMNADEYAIPASIRGKTVVFQTEGRRIQGTSQIRWDPRSALSLDITFQERAG